MAKQVGKVTHYFDKIGVAVLALDNTLKVGDRIAFKKGEEELFEQEVESMQIDHKPVNKAKKGDDIAVKIDEKVKEGILVFKA